MKYREVPQDEANMVYMYLVGGYPNWDQFSGIPYQQVGQIAMNTPEAVPFFYSLNESGMWTTQPVNPMMATIETTIMPQIGQNYAYQGEQSRNISPTRIERNQISPVPASGYYYDPSSSPLVREGRVDRRIESEVVEAKNSEVSSEEMSPQFTIKFNKRRYHKKAGRMAHQERSIERSSIQVSSLEEWSSSQRELPRSPSKFLNNPSKTPHYPPLSPDNPAMPSPEKIPEIPISTYPNLITSNPLLHESESHPAP